MINYPVFIKPPVLHVAVADTDETCGTATVRPLAEDHARRSPDPEIPKIRMKLIRSPGFRPWTQDRQGTLNSRKPWWMRVVLAVAFGLKIARVKLRAPGYPEIGKNLCPISKGSCETKVPRSPGYPSLSKLRFFQDR